MSPAAFQRLPIEVNQMIASYLTDHDLCNYRLACSSTAHAIEDLSFWRSRFLQYFDHPARDRMRNLRDFREHYQFRRKWMRRGAIFKDGTSPAEVVCIKMLKDLILEADPTLDLFDRPHSLNFDAIQQFVKNHNFTRCLFKDLPKAAAASKAVAARNPDLATIQLVLASHFLDRKQSGNHVSAFEMSQKAAYMPVTKAPLFQGPKHLDVNVAWALHVLNFFRHHALRQDESFHHGYHSLTEDELPHMWTNRLSADNPPLSKVWKGTYAYLERQEIGLIRSNCRSNNIFYQDRNIDHGEEALQTLKLYIPNDDDDDEEEEKEKNEYLTLFEHILKPTSKNSRAAAAAAKIPKTRAQHRLGDLSSSFRFGGLGYDDERFLAAGWMNPLPPQNGIPGWQRMTMMKYFVDHNGIIDRHALWAYEGVVLPGGKVIVGRWWSPDEGTDNNQYSGPFIFWSVDPSIGREERDWVEDYRGLDPDYVPNTLGRMGVS